MNLFTDLAVVTLPSGTSVKGALEKFLVALDVRRHVDVGSLSFFWDPRCYIRLKLVLDYLASIGL